LPDPWLGVVVVPVEGAMVTLGVVVVVDDDPVPVAPKATAAPIATPPTIVARTAALDEAFADSLHEPPSSTTRRFARADQEPLGISSTPPKRSGTLS
jgi:hypothetical protein